VTLASEAIVCQAAPALPVAMILIYLTSLKPTTATLTAPKTYQTCQIKLIIAVKILATNNKVVKIK
jgi:hypothetical protein